MALFLVTYAANITCLIKYFISRSGRRQRGQLGFLGATIVACLAATNDFLTTAQLYEFPYTFEYGFGAILTAVGYVLMMRFGELHAVVKDLNLDLTRINRDLVVALERANESVRAKTEFLATVSHELRTPLNAIINLPQGLHAKFESLRGLACESCHAEFELEPNESWHVGLSCAACGAATLAQQNRSRFAGDADEAQRCLATVTRAGKHLLALVSDVLEVSKLDLGRTVIAPTPFDPVELVRDVIDSAQAIADEKEISLRFPDTAGSGPLILADRVKLQQVLWNLLGNAIKFSPRGAAIEASISRPARDECLICSGWPSRRASSSSTAEPSGSRASLERAPPFSCGFHHPRRRQPRATYRNPCGRDISRDMDPLR